MIFIDLQKAFDTIDHNILLLKIPSLGSHVKLLIDISPTYVNVHDKFSTSADLQCGVPQRSILGLLLFLFYVNDMPQAVDCDLFLYAELAKNFSILCGWFVDNKSSLHFGEDKTKSILFSTRNRKRKIGTLAIQYGDVKIKQ